MSDSELSIVEVTITEFQPGYRIEYADLMSQFFTVDPDEYTKGVEGLPYSMVELSQPLHGLSFKFFGQSLGDWDGHTMLEKFVWSQSLEDIVGGFELERIMADGLELLEKHKAELIPASPPLDVVPFKFLTVWEAAYYVSHTDYGKEVDTEWYYLGPLDEQKLNFAFKYTPDLRPEIVCLCGSTRFYDEFQRANYRETMKGNIVLTVGFYPHSQEQAHGETVGVTPEQKIALDALHLRKIDLADRVLILNASGYIGESTGRELEYAQSRGKVIEFLEPDKAEAK